MITDRTAALDAAAIASEHGPDSLARLLTPAPAPARPPGLRAAAKAEAAKIIAAVRAKG